MRFGSVCSGIEAASVAWEPLGWKAAWFSEIEPFPSAVLAHHYPDTPNHGDMTTLPARILAAEVEAPDLFCGGTPCQAFSVAGLRKSLDDARGNLSLTFVEIADAIDDVRRDRGELPAVVFWENVPGVLSTADNAFGCFLAGLAGDDEPAVPPRGKWKAAGVVVGPERLVAWRVLDAQFFGVAQRRRRVFAVGVSLRHPRAWAIAESILPLVEGVQRNPPARGKAGEGAAVCPTLRAGGNSTGGDRPPGTDVDTADSLQVVQPYPVGNTLTARMHKGINTTLDEGQTPVLAQAVAVRTANTSANGHGISAELAHTLDQAQGQAVAVPMVNMQGSKGNAVAQADGPSFTLNAMHGHDVHAVLAPTLTASNDPSRSPQSSEITAQVAAVVQATAVAVDTYNHTVTGELAATISARTGIPDATGPRVMAAMQVRRLTPVECERLQGFPDGYTAIPWRGKQASECPDGPRYKALGNSWAVPVVRWIGRRIAAQIA